MEQLLCHKATFSDFIYTYIELSNFAIRIVDTPIFQRLRSLKQLGVCNYIYQNAVHTRFEHSLGTYHLAKKLLENINKTIKDNNNDDFINNYLDSIKELKHYFNTHYNGQKRFLDPYICELIQIAALCHDIGHGPFSHIFDDVFIKITNNNSLYAKHEYRSEILLKKIIKSDSLLSNIVTDDEITFMCNIINPDININTGFLYQIVSNNLNGLDVDKYDYLSRDSKILNIGISFNCYSLIEGIKIIDNIICFPEYSLNNILNLFYIRHYMHRQVYGNNKVISAQCIITEILLSLDHILHISNSINDMDAFIQLTDDYILNYIKFLYHNLSNNLYSDFTQHIIVAYDLLVQLTEKHDLYTLIDKIVTVDETLFTVNDIIKLSNTLIDSNDIIIFRNKIGYVSGDKDNPLDNIYTFCFNNIATKCDKNNITKLLSPIYQEHITFIFYKKKNDIIINELKHILFTFH